jgi:hypothetical protein
MKILPLYDTNRESERKEGFYMKKKEETYKGRSIYTTENIAKIEDNQQIEKKDTDEITHLMSEMSHMGQ